MPPTPNQLDLPHSKLSRIFFLDYRLSWLWLAVRIYVGWTWLMAGWEKMHNAAWTGDKAGLALQGFISNALTKTTGTHPDVQWWYAAFLRNFVQNHTTIFSYLVAYGELLVGIALILGIVTGIAAFFGAFMNTNYLLAGAVSINPILLILEICLMLAWRISGHLGMDKFILKKIYHIPQTLKIDNG